MANPIASVNGATIKCPSKYQYGLQDVSASDAGRTEAVTMDKKRIGQCVKVELSWAYLTTAEASAILRAFNPEYITVRYLDLLSGAYRTSEFYVGDRTAPMYNAEMGLWENVSFDIIERTGRK
jgi:hypothetical protein